MSERWLGDPGDKPWSASEWSGLRLGWEPVDGIFFSNATPGKVGGLPLFFSMLLESFFLIFSADLVSDLLRGGNTDGSERIAGFRSEPLLGLPRGFRGLALTVYRN